MPGATIRITFEIDDRDKLELASALRNDPDPTAKAVANLLDDAKAEPIEFDEDQAKAIHRAIESNRAHLDGHPQLLKLQRILWNRFDTDV